MRIKILKPGLTVLEKAQEVGAIVNDPNPNECANLVRDGRAEYLSPEEDAAEQAKEDAAAADAQAAAEKAAESTPPINPTPA